MAKKKIVSKKKTTKSKAVKTVTKKKTGSKKPAAKKKAPAKKKIIAKKPTSKTKAKPAVKKKVVKSKVKPAAKQKAPVKKKVIVKKATTKIKAKTAKKTTANKARTVGVKSTSVKKKAPVKKTSVSKIKTAKTSDKKAETKKKSTAIISKDKKVNKIAKVKTKTIKEITPKVKKPVGRPKTKISIQKEESTKIAKRGRPKKEVIQMPVSPRKTKKEVKAELKNIKLIANPNAKTGTIDPRKIKVKRPILPVPKIIPIRKKPQPKVQTEAPKGTRYSDTDLEVFKAVIIKKLTEAKKELIELQSQMNHANEHGTDDTASTFKVMEDGSETLAKEEAGQLASRQRKFIAQLENALIRIQNKTYGICRITGNLIRKERLLAVPHTTQSIEAKLNQN